MFYWLVFFFFSIRRRHTRLSGDWSSDVCSSDLMASIRQMSRQGLRGSAGEYQADERAGVAGLSWRVSGRDRKSTRLNSSHHSISYAVFCLKKKKNQLNGRPKT